MSSRHSTSILQLCCLSISFLSSLISLSNASAIPLVSKSSIEATNPNLLSLARELGLDSNSQQQQQSSRRSSETNNIDLEARQVPANQGSGIPNNATSLSGTWSSGAAHVVTGLGFYDPGTLSFTYPKTAGQCYSFTDDGFWEQALYLYTANPSKPACPQAQLIWQHGTYTLNSNNTLTLNPIEGDGQQMIVDRCSSSTTSVQPYNQKEDMNGFEIHQMIHYGNNVWGLQLYEFNGALKPMLYQIYNPPQMLPTVQLHKQIFGSLNPKNATL